MSSYFPIDRRWLVLGQARYFALVLVIGGVAIGCSWMTDFVVVNRSADTLELVITGKSHPFGRTDIDCGIPDFLDQMKMMNADDIGKKERWVLAPRQSLQVDLKACTIRILIAPQMGVGVAKIVTYTGKLDSRSAQSFLVESLEIRSSQGTIAYSGLELLKRFKRSSDALYVLTYQTDPDRPWWKWCG